MNPVAAGFLASLAAGLMTGVGALPVLVGTAVTRRANDVLLGFAAGVMLSASFFSLLLPAIDTARESYGGDVLAAAIAVGGTVLGAAVIAAINEWVPHEHFSQGLHGPRSEALARIWLFVIAITIHNAPEGLAVGVGFGAGDIAAGTTLAFGIGLQNMPEGLAVAVALRGSGYAKAQAFAIAGLTGLVEPVAGLAGAYAVSLSHVILPWGLSFAAGAMIYVISHEIIPETHRNGFARESTAGMIVGLVVMMFLDVAFG